VGGETKQDMPYASRENSSTIAEAYEITKTKNCGGGTSKLKVRILEKRGKKTTTEGEKWEMVGP